MTVSIRTDPPVEHATGVTNRIRSRMPEMSGVMLRIADYLLENPDAPLTLTIGELAADSGVSAATITRFCRIIGYTGYAPFRVDLAKDFGRSTARDSWQTDIGRAFGPDDSAPDVLSTLLNAHTRTLRETADVIDLEVMLEIAAAIARARNVDIYGVGGSAMLADEMQARLYRIGISTHAWSEVHAGLTSAAIQGPDSVALGISNTGRTEETIQMLRQAGRAGALTVAISNNPDSPLVAASTLAIITSAHERFLQPDDLSAKHGQLFVLDLLYLFVAQQNFERTTKRLAASALAVAPHRRPTKAGALSETASPAGV
ncbi:MurR/RpiR family transcriptional regulator [Plantibacter sp. PA-3-X8]|uniref:MurR/RpiR family transcriptional regulator n=1 Tax=Plantibacter sp. PA-3-X8 TaxID=2480625 RepID=UPI000F5EE665|nr:MurR/RpiR family transcriptional regulator [Plantibacter sp. PA-3-X8]AZH83474.1 MurR/RpiR family transcriptional regulator [Plantibacter sp. PA-3-X8]